jgi:peptide/nickel transport system permease protein
VTGRLTEAVVPQPTVAPQPVALAARGRRHPLARFVALRVLSGLGTLLVVSVLVFTGTEVLPGDAAGAVLGKNATPAQVREVQAAMGLDRSAPERYLSWLGGVVTGDLGNTAAGYASGSVTTVWSQISGKLSNSLVLAAITTLLLIPLSLLLGVIAAIRAGRPADHAISLTSLAIISLPEFIIGSLLILFFFYYLGLLPPTALVPPGTSPLAHPDALILPVLTLLGASLAASIRMVRAGMVEALQTDYVQMARLQGFRERKVVVRYALRNALGPSVQVFAQNIQYLVGGIIVTEYLFSYPGLGAELVNAVAIRDVREVQSIAILIAAIYIGLNILADLLQVLLVPKLRTR